MLDRILRYLSSMIFGWLTILVFTTTGCVISLSSLSTQWSNNLLADPELEITDPNLTDGNLETVALSVSRQKKINLDILSLNFHEPNPYIKLSFTIKIYCCLRSNI